MAQIACPYCGRQWDPPIQPKLGVLKRTLLAHLRSSHGPLRRADVRALHALPAAALRAWTTPVDTRRTPE